MNAAWIIILAIFALWGLIAAVIVGIDGRARRRTDALLELRDWEEKVQAMRRLQDQEGDA